ncbi:hypothetical protein [Nocardia wallacei]|uniref:hypothetical protein n=1 Tax=Nocardia wallacei TaxID=480035 RepID=UPI002457250A|nr:hypothetical protein [Nocardia wallacei]
MPCNSRRFDVSDARLAPIPAQICAADCSGGSHTINQPSTRPAIGGTPSRGLPGLVDPVLDETGTTLSAGLTGTPDAVVKAAARHTVTTLHTTEPHLDEIFHSHYADAEAAPQPAA